MRADPDFVPLERLAFSDVLTRVGPFTAALPSEVDDLAAAALRLRRAAGTTLIEEGARPDGLFVVLRGRLNLVRHGRGREVILATLAPGDVFGETCVFEEWGMSSAAVAATGVELLKIPAEAVAAHVQRFPSTLFRIMRSVAEKLREIENVASSLALHGVEERLRRALLRLATQRRGNRSAAEELVVAPAPTQAELARMVGSCRETVSRTLSNMAKNGLVQSRGRRMVLHRRLLEPTDGADVAA